MWGNILVGVKPGADLKTPTKTTHVHLPDEDKMDNMPGMKPADKTPVKKPDDISSMPGMDHSPTKMQMSSVSNIGDPMSRESSGTSWAPDSSPIYAKVKMYENGGVLTLMETRHFSDIQASGRLAMSRSPEREAAAARTHASMFMLMYSKPMSMKNRNSGFACHERASIPLSNAATAIRCCTRAASFCRAMMHDRQHPHDLVDELAVTYSRKFGSGRSFYIYAGLPGEPALGPPAFIHRRPASNNPDAPIGHHWQDATHITFGVITAGFSLGKTKFEASTFNGREPDDNRYAFDRPRLDSFSGRLSFNPTKKTGAFQMLHGYLRDPERSEPAIHILHKTTASAIYNKKFNDDRNWASTFIFGQNYANGERTNSVLFESNYDFGKNAVFGRFERVKERSDLVLAPVLEHNIILGRFGVAGLCTRSDQGQRHLCRPWRHGDDQHKSLNSDSLLHGGTTHGGWQLFHLRFRPSRSFCPASGLFNLASSAFASS